MKDIIEIRWHARGGQGAKTAAVFLAEAVIEAGRFSQGFPEYGPERMGAPIRAFNRIGDRQIRVNCSVDEPDAVVILDSTLLQTENVAEGAKEDSVFIVNTKSAPDEIRQRLNLSNGKVYTVDATQIALDEIGRPIPNMPMIGALIRVMEIVSPEVLYDAMQKQFSGKFSQNIIDGNIKATKRAYDEMKG